MGRWIETQNKSLIDLSKVKMIEWRYDPEMKSSKIIAHIDSEKIIVSNGPHAVIAREMELLAEWICETELMFSFE